MRYACACITSGVSFGAFANCLEMLSLAKPATQARLHEPCTPSLCRIHPAVVALQACAATPAFCLGSEDPNSSCHACTASTLTQGSNPTYVDLFF